MTTKRFNKHAEGVHGPLSWSQYHMSSIRASLSLTVLLLYAAGFYGVEGAQRLPKFETLPWSRKHPGRVDTYRCAQTRIEDCIISVTVGNQQALYGSVSVLAGTIIRAV